MPSGNSPTASSSHCSTSTQEGNIDQVSSMDEGLADQEPLEDAIKLEPIHFPVFKSSGLLEAAGCILSHPALAALSAQHKPNRLCESPAPPLAAIPCQILATASLLAFSTFQIRGFSPAANFLPQMPAADSAEVKLSKM